MTNKQPTLFDITSKGWSAIWALGTRQDYEHGYTQTQHPRCHREQPKQLNRVAHG